MTSLESRESNPDADPFFNFERESPRCSLRLYIKRPEDVQFEERRGNVGTGGFFCEGSERHVPGTELDIAFVLPDLGIRVDAKGEVLDLLDEPGHRGTRGRFTHMRSGDRDMLSRWLSETAQRGRQGCAA